MEGRTLISGTQLSKAPERKPRDAEGDRERGQAPERRKSHLIQQTIENGINPPLLLSHGTCGQSKKQHRLKPGGSSSVCGQAYSPLDPVPSLLSKVSSTTT